VSFHAEAAARRHEQVIIDQNSGTKRRRRLIGKPLGGTGLVRLAQRRTDEDQRSVRRVRN
jgi:hypothetical protein